MKSTPREGIARVVNLVLVIAAAACSGNHEDVGTGAQKLISLGSLVHVDAADTTAEDHNLSGVFTQASSPTAPNIYAVGFENDETDYSNLPNYPFGWAWSTSSSGSYTRCYDHATGCTALHTSAISDWYAWGGQPSLAADGVGNVAYVTLYKSSSTSGLDQVAVVMSHDGGETFGGSDGKMLSLTDGAGEGCDSGTQRLPNVAVDITTTPPTYWAVWGHKGSGSFGGCIRSFTYDPTSDTVSTGGPAAAGYTIDNMEREGLDDGQGALIVQAADGMVTVAYDNQDNVASSCPAGNNGMAWETVSTVNGADWTSKSRVVHTSTFDWCAIGNTDGTDDSTSRIIKGTREFDFIVAPDGNSYLAVNDTNDSIRLYMSATRGVKIPGIGATNDSPWREYCDGGSGATSNWTAPGAACSTALVAPGTEVFRPVLSADGNSRISLMWYQRVDPVGGGHGVEVEYMGNVAPRMQSSPASGLQGGSFQGPTTLESFFDPNPSLYTDRHKALGFYMTMPSSRLAAAAALGTNDAQPYWTFVSSAPLRVIDTRSVTLTPP